MSALTAVTNTPPPEYPEILSAAWREAIAPREPDAPTVISTFAGGGGSTTGYCMAGYHELLAVEWNANACETLRLNYPDLPIYQGDIAALTIDEVLELTGLDVGDLDVLDGSPPCQGFSTAGKRQLDDPRNQLFREYSRLLRGLQPRAFVMENVSGMIKGNMKLLFAEILRELKACGYKVSARLLNAAYFGVPQARQRLIFIGAREDLEIEPTHPTAQTRPMTLRQALRGLPEGQIGGNVTPLKAKRWAQTKRGKHHHERFSLLRLAWDKPAPTILTVSGSGGHMHPDEPRLLSTQELARLSTFPDEYRFIGGWNHEVERIGNSVPPLLMRAIADHVKQTILEVAHA